MALKRELFEIYRDTRGEWRWRFKAKNGETIAVSSEGYVRKIDCRRGITLIRTTIAGVRVLKDEEEEA